MKSSRRRFRTRNISLLVLCLFLSTPLAGAAPVERATLKTPEPAEAKGGLEELQAALARTASTLFPPSTAPAAGLEEQGERLGLQEAFEKLRARTGIVYFRAPFSDGLGPWGSDDELRARLTVMAWGSATVSLSHDRNGPAVFNPVLQTTVLERVPVEVEPAVQLLRAWAVLGTTIHYDVFYAGFRRDGPIAFNEDLARQWLDEKAGRNPTQRHVAFHLNRDGPEPNPRWTIEVVPLPAAGLEEEGSVLPIARAAEVIRSELGVALVTFGPPLRQTRVKSRPGFDEELPQLLTTMARAGHVVLTRPKAALIHVATPSRAALREAGVTAGLEEGAAQVGTAKLTALRPKLDAAARAWDAVPVEDLAAVTAPKVDLQHSWHLRFTQEARSPDLVVLALRRRWRVAAVLDGRAADSDLERLRYLLRQLSETYQHLWVIGDLEAVVSWSAQRRGWGKDQPVVLRTREAALQQLGITDEMLQLDVENAASLPKSVRIAMARTRDYLEARPAVAAWQNVSPEVLQQACLTPPPSGTLLYFPSSDPNVLRWVIPAARRGWRVSVLAQTPAVAQWLDALLTALSVPPTQYLIDTAMIPLGKAEGRRGWTGKTRGDILTEEQARAVLGIGREDFIPREMALALQLSRPTPLAAGLEESDALPRLERDVVKTVADIMEKRFSDPRISSIIQRSVAGYLRRGGSLERAAQQQADALANTTTLDGGEPAARARLVTARVMAEILSGQLPFVPRDLVSFTTMRTVEDLLQQRTREDQALAQLGGDSQHARTIFDRAQALYAAGLEERKVEELRALAVEAWKVAVRKGLPAARPSDKVLIFKPDSNALDLAAIAVLQNRRVAIQATTADAAKQWDALFAQPPFPRGAPVVGIGWFGVSLQLRSRNWQRYGYVEITTRAQALGLLKLPPDMKDLPEVANALTITKDFLLAIGA